MSGANSAANLVRVPAPTQRLAFTQDQARAIAHRGSPLILRGGPGTGKSSTLVAAALSRISQGQDPNSILMITYGRERAAELRDAVALQTTVAMTEPIARTFHSLAFSILKMKAHPDDPEPILMSGPEQDFFIRQLLEGDLEMGAQYWPSELVDPQAPAIATRGFAKELRDLILRAAERNLAPSDLVEMAQDHGEKYWRACAHFWKQYLEALSMQEVSAGDAKRKIDPSQIVTESFHHLLHNPALADQLRDRFKTILVDEFQESDPAQRNLLRALAGAEIMLCVDRESAVGRFRGADPDALESELERYRTQGSEILLRECFRSSPNIFNLATAIASHFPDPRVATSRICGVPPTPQQGAPLVARLRSQSEEAQFIAYQFRRAHLVDGLPWAQMAVIVRAPGAHSAAIRRAFVQAGIPVTSEIEALSNNSAIAPFLLVAQIALGVKKLTAPLCEELLLSEIGGADTISLRRIKRLLLRSRTEEDQRTGAQLLISAIENGDVLEESAKPLIRIHELLASARKVLRRRSAQGEDLLWDIWSNAETSSGEKISEAWRRQALRGGSRGAAADRDLDAMMQLFESARRFADRFPYAKAESFIRQISQEDILGDVITAKGQRSEVVEILTVHGSKGREWEMVAVAGLQDGLWPNLRQRGSLLGSERLVERVRHSGVVATRELDALAASGLIEDERRLIYVALTRAKSQLLVSCVQKDDAEPSSFFEEIETSVLGVGGAAAAASELPRPLTASALVATLRGALGGEEKHLAAGLLRTLADEGISAANPDSWYGVAPLSSDKPIVPPGMDISVSPSGAASFSECGLKWFLEKSGGSDGDSTAQVLGSAIHAFAALMESDPNLGEEDLLAKLRAAWNLIDPNVGWVHEGQLTKAVEMIRKFVRYHQESKGEIVGVEAPFAISIGRARIRGSVDRLEVSSNGDLYVIDFKTGSVAPSKSDAQSNMQMKAYQLAIVEGGFAELHPSKNSAGAELVYLGTKGKEASIRPQAPIDIASVRAEVAQIAEEMSGSAFLAMINQRCGQCAVRSSCPIQSEGRTVVE